MRIIFLDVDGVLSPHGASRGLCGMRLDLFCALVLKLGVYVVLSSMWRLPALREQRKRLQQELCRRGVELYGVTPVLNGSTGVGLHGKVYFRGDEIQAWLNGARCRDKITSFIILDDDPNDEMGALKPHLVKTDGYKGLTLEICQEIERRWPEMDPPPSFI